MTAVFKLIPTTQKYDWGKIGLSSKVAQYASAGKLPGFTLDETAPYAEVSNTTAFWKAARGLLRPGEVRGWCTLDGDDSIGKPMRNSDLDNASTSSASKAARRPHCDAGHLVRLRANRIAKRMTHFCARSL